jgi:hypothetical protein
VQRTPSRTTCGVKLEGFLVWICLFCETYLCFCIDLTVFFAWGSSDARLCSAPFLRRPAPHAARQRPDEELAGLDPRLGLPPFLPPRAAAYVSFGAKKNCVSQPAKGSGEKNAGLEKKRGPRQQVFKKNRRLHPRLYYSSWVQV